MLVSYKNKYFYFIFILLFLENMKFISLFSSLVIVIAIIYLFILKKYELSLVFLLLSSSYVNTEFSIYDLKLFYIVLLILLLSRTIKIKKNYLLIYISLFTYFVLIGLLSIEVNFYALRYWIKDILFFIIPITIYLTYKEINFKKFMDYIFIYIIAFIYVKLILALGGFGIENNWYDDYKTIFADEIEGLFILFLISAILFDKSNIQNKINYSILLVILIFIILFYTGAGSQLIILALLPFFLWVFKNYIKTGIFLILILSLGVNSISIESNKYLEHKFNNIMSLVEVFDNNIEVIPRSPKVRIIESINIIDNDFFIFGKGFAGNFHDDSYAFGNYLNQDDFSDYEASHRKFYNPHNWNYGLLKYGILYIIIIIFISYRLIKKRDNETNKIFFYSLLVYVSFNFGWTYKIAVLTGVLLIYTLRRENEKTITN